MLRARKPQALLFTTALVLASTLSCSKESKPVVPTDTTPPTIVAHFPSSGATEVTRSGPFWLAFSETMNNESVGEALSFAPSFDFNTHWSADTVFVSPTSLLAAGTVYTVTVGTSAEDVAGNNLSEAYSFDFTTTSEEDTTPPTIVSTVPEDGATGVNGVAPIEIVFSEPMAPGATEGATAVDPSVSMETDWQAKKMVITHAAFPSDSLITVTVNTAATDLAGNHLAAEYSFSFRTATDVVRPELSGSTPRNGATHVSRDITEIELVFSEPVDMFSFDSLAATDVDARLFQLPSAEPSFDPTGTILTMDIGKPLLQGCTYWANLRDITDGAGNALNPNPTPYQFTTSGGLTYYPILDPNRWSYAGEGSSTVVIKIQNYNQSTGDFETARLDGDGNVRNVERLRYSPGAIYHLGTTDYKEDGSFDYSLTWDDPIPYVLLPLESHLGETRDVDETGTARTNDGENYDLTASGTIEIEPGMTDVVSDRLAGTFKNCIVFHLHIKAVFYSGVDTLAVLQSHDVSYFAPSVGMIKKTQTDVVSSESDSILVYDWATD